MFRLWIDNHIFTVDSHGLYSASERSVETLKLTFQQIFVQRNGNSRSDVSESMEQMFVKNNRISGAQKQFIFNYILVGICIVASEAPCWGMGLNAKIAQSTVKEIQIG